MTNEEIQAVFDREEREAKRRREAIHSFYFKGKWYCYRGGLVDTYYGPENQYEVWEEHAPDGNRAIATVQECMSVEACVMQGIMVLRGEI